jgi:hypothetical protein
MALAQTAGFLARRSEATRFAVLVNRVDDPADSGVTADSLVAGVHEDDFEVLVRGILVDPVRVEDAEVGAATADSLFSGGAEGALVLELVHTLVGRFAVGSTLWHWLLATTAADSNSVDHIALLGLVAETTGLVWSRRAGSAVDDVQLSELPAADSEKESKDIGLLLFLKFLDVFEGTHLDCWASRRTVVDLRGLRK